MFSASKDSHLPKLIGATKQTSLIIFMCNTFLYYSLLDPFTFLFFFPFTFRVIHPVTVKLCPKPNKLLYYLTTRFIPERADNLFVFTYR